MGVTARANVLFDSPHAGHPWPADAHTRQVGARRFIFHASIKHAGSVLGGTEAKAKALG